jgi:Tfp pilus assembly protein FimT
MEACRRLNFAMKTFTRAVFTLAEIVIVVSLVSSLAAIAFLNSFRLGRATAFGHRSECARA